MKNDYSHQSGLRLKVDQKYFIETRIDGFPWTKSGCNPYFSGKYHPYSSHSVAQENIERLKSQDDPMWAQAEYRLVPA